MEKERFKMNQLDRNQLDEQIKEIQSLYVADPKEESLKDSEFSRLISEFGVKKEYNYGKSYYGQATVWLLNGSNGAIFRNDNGFTSYHKNATEAFDRARSFVSYRYELTRMMGF